MIRRAMSVFVLALLTTPLFSADAPDAPPKNGAEAARWEGLQKQLRDIQKELGELRRARDTNDAALYIELEAFKDRLGKLEKTVERMNASSRVSSYFTPGTPAATGVIRLENRTLVAATVIVNNRSYNLQPQQAVLIQSQPAGTFTYEVLADGFGTIRAPVSRVLASGETFTIAINP